MKIYYIKIILVLIALFTFNSTNAQYQSIFGSSQTSWNVIKGNLWGTGTDSLVTVSDTVINSNSYKKILYYDLTSGLPQIESIIGFLREDSTQGKAWYFNTEDTNEQLIMDLNLNLGDTFYIGGIWNSYLGYHPVDSIWLELGRKHIRLDVEINPNTGGNNNEKVTFIEGVGTNIGIGYQDLNYIDNSPYLLCSYKNGNSEFQNTHPVFIGNCDYTTVGINDYIDNSNFQIYPNPSTNKLTLKYKSNNSKDLTIEIYNSTGKLKLIQKMDAVEKITINTNNIPTGIYFISIKNEHNIIATKKWIKTE